MLRTYEHNQLSTLLFPLAAAMSTYSGFWNRTAWREVMDSRWRLKAGRSTSAVRSWVYRGRPILLLRRFGIALI